MATLGMTIEMKRDPSASRPPRRQRQGSDFHERHTDTPEGPAPVAAASGDENNQSEMMGVVGMAASEQQRQSRSEQGELVAEHIGHADIDEKQQPQGERKQLGQQLRSDELSKLVSHLLSKVSHQIWSDIERHGVPSRKRDAQ
jgi:hypothetical protein